MRIFCSKESTQIHKNYKMIDDPLQCTVILLRNKLRRVWKLFFDVMLENGCPGCRPSKELHSWDDEFAEFHTQISAWMPCWDSTELTANACTTNNCVAVARRSYLGVGLTHLEVRAGEVDGCRCEQLGARSLVCSRGCFWDVGARRRRRGVQLRITVFNWAAMLSNKLSGYLSPSQ